MVKENGKKIVVVRLKWSRYAVKAK